MNRAFCFAQNSSQPNRIGRASPWLASLVSFAAALFVGAASARGQLELIASAGDLTPDGVDTIHVLGPGLIRADGQISFYAGLNGINYDENPAHIRAILQTREDEIVSILQESKSVDRTWVLTTWAQNNAGLFAYTGKRFHTFYDYPVNVVETFDPNGVVTNYYQTSVIWETISPPALNASGAVAFAAEGGVHRGMNGTLAVIALNRQEVADGSGHVFGLDDSYKSSPIINVTGDVAFTAQVRIGGLDKSAVFRGNGSGPPTVVARTGMQLPDGSSLTGAFSSFPALNDAGDVAMFMESEGAWWISEAIYHDRAGTLAPIAKIGDAAPDGNGVLANVNAAGIFRNVRPAMNQHGEVAFIAELSDTAAGELDNTAIYRGDGSLLTQIARRGQTVPTGDGQFQGFYSVLGNNAYGEVAFIAGVSRHGHEDWEVGIFLGNGIDTIQIAETGQLIEGGELIIPLGPRIQSLTDPYRTFLNDRGQLAFNATVAGIWKNFRFTPPEVNWQNVAGGQWSIAQNWAGQMPPGSLYQTKIEALTGPMLVQGPNVATTVRSLILGGEIGATATLQLSGASTIEFRAIGEVAISSLGRLVLRDGRSLAARNIDNRGRILIEAGSSEISGAVVNTGLISIGAGSAATFLSEVSGDGSVVVAAGSTVTFAESYSGNRIGGPGSVVFNGAVTPHGPTRRLVIDGDATFGETAELEITFGGSIAGSPHDSVVFQGHVALGGTLSLTAANGNIPPVNQSFTLLQYGSRSGQFDLVEFDHSLPSGLDWAIIYTATGVELTTNALAGDIDLDGNVDRSDLALLTANLGTPTGASWTTGDLNADGTTSLHDLMLLRNLLGAGATSPTAPSASPFTASTPVPEPAMHWMAVAMLVCVAVSRQFAWKSLRT